MRARSGRPPLQSSTRPTEASVAADDFLDLTAPEPPPVASGPQYAFLELFLTAQLPLEGQERPWRAVVSDRVPLADAYRNEAAALNDLGALGWRVVAVDRYTDRTARVISCHYVMERELSSSE